MIVGKAVKMAEMMDVSVLGIVENMSYFECPDCKDVYKRQQLHSNYHVTLPHHILTFSHLAICFIIIIIHRILNTFALINLADIF